MNDIGRFFIGILSIIVFGSIFFVLIPNQVSAGEQCDVHDLTSSVGNAPFNRNSFTPRISADGTRISFESHRDFLGTNTDLNREIYYYDSTIDGFIQITNTTGATNRFADISGNGNRIVFKSPLDIVSGNNTDLNQEHFLFDITPNSILQLTNTTGGGNSSREFPLSNSDGTIFAFVSPHNFVGTNSDGNDLPPYNRSMC